MRTRFGASRWASICLGLSFSWLTGVAQANPVLDYKVVLSEDGSTYEVWMKPIETPTPDISLSGQVTLRVPHAAAFKSVNVKPAFEGVTWTEASRVDAPKENPDYDYISFSFFGVQGNDSAQKYNWTADKETLVFSFANQTGCVNGVTIMANDDPFNVPNNSASTNPGNHFSNLGWTRSDENNFRQVYGESPKCPK